MKQVFIIIWLGQPFVFGTYEAAKKWLLSRVPYVTDLEIRFSVYCREVVYDDISLLDKLNGTTV